MKKVKIHTVDQPESDTTTFVLSCDRLEVLRKTINSYIATRDYPTKMVIVDDSGKSEVFDHLVENYGGFSDVICFPRNRSQWWAMDFMVSYCDTDYIFYLEDDWELLKSGYLNASKVILEKYREIGVIDISWRTFEFQGIDSYDRQLVDGMFYWKKPWKTTDDHHAWFMWCGSPNLKRRDDLIMLGRVEKWHNEWNIDRKFAALGFRGVFLNGEYARHLGDNCSKMEGKRPNDHAVPYDYYPPEVLKNRVIPRIDYYGLDSRYEFPADVTVVSCFLDAGGGIFHNWDALDELLKIRNPLVLYAEVSEHERIIERRKELSIATSDNKITVLPISTEAIEIWPSYHKIRRITETNKWKEQAAWIKNSSLCSSHYLPLSLLKTYMLKDVSDRNPHNSKRFYWIDSDTTSKFSISEPLTNFDFLKLPNNDRILISSFLHVPDKEIHGYSVNSITDMLGLIPQYMCRATLFGGNKQAIQTLHESFLRCIESSLNAGEIGTEEAILTILEHSNPEIFHRMLMPNGNVSNLLEAIRK
jgi:glycosyltransferase involved in cell wall biosynthesis